MFRWTQRHLSLEVWFALGGLLLGLALLSYRYGLPNSASGVTNVDSTATASRGPASPTASPTASSGAGSDDVSVTLGTAISVSDVASPKLEFPEGDPLLPPTSPEADAVLALKYYLLSDAEAEAKQLFDAIPREHRDLILRSALYAIWDRSDQDSSKGDWFRGDTNDPFTSRNSAQGAGYDPVTNTDNIDGTPSDVRVAYRCKLALARIKFVHELLKQVEPKTQAYWAPYLVIKLRRMASPETALLITELVTVGNQAIATSLKSIKAEGYAPNLGKFVSRFGNAIFPLVLSALGFILAKISQSTLSSVDRWVGARLSKTAAITSTDAPPAPKT